MANKDKKNKTSLNQDEIITSEYEMINKDFQKEKHLQEYIIDNIDLFCEEILNDKLISFEAEYSLRNKNRKYKRGKDRIDLFVRCEKNNYLIELKNPTYKYENSHAIGQLFNYGAIFNKPCQLILVSTRYDFDTVNSIVKYNLPIRFIYISKSKVMEFKRFLT